MFQRKRGRLARVLPLFILGILHDAGRQNIFAGLKTADFQTLELRGIYRNKISRRPVMGIRSFVFGIAVKKFYDVVRAEAEKLSQKLPGLSFRMGLAESVRRRALAGSKRPTIFLSAQNSDFIWLISMSAAAR